MEEAFVQYGLTVAGQGAFGGSSFWMRAQHSVDTEEVAERLRAKGVLIEPGRPFFTTEEAPKNYYRLAYSSLPVRQNRGRCGLDCQRDARPMIPTLAALLALPISESRSAGSYLPNRRRRYADFLALRCRRMVMASAALIITTSSTHPNMLVAGNDSVPFMLPDVSGRKPTGRLRVGLAIGSTLGVPFGLSTDHRDCR